MESRPPPTTPSLVAILNADSLEEDKFQTFDNGHKSICIVMFDYVWRHTLSVSSVIALIEYIKVA